MQSIKHFISPNFTHEKLETSRYEDLLDVFEDRMRNWIIIPAKHLLELHHGEIAAVAIATSYIEGIEIYISGKDSKNQSNKFFRSGFHRIFNPTSTSQISQDTVADTI